MQKAFSADAFLQGYLVVGRSLNGLLFQPLLVLIFPSCDEAAQAWTRGRHAGR